jgi:ankyrin repeat protein
MAEASLLAESIIQAILAARHSPDLLDRIRTVVDAADPSSVTIPHRKGLTPLHVICMKTTQMPVMEYLVERYPECVTAKDRFGLLPLHYACKGTAPVHVVEYLIKQYPESVRVQDRRGRLPLSHAILRADTPPLELIQCLVERYPDSLKLQHPWDGLPLHLACLAYKTEAPMEVLHYLVKQFPDSVKSQSIDHSRLPLHAACLANAPFPVIQYLVQPSHTVLGATLPRVGLRKRSVPESSVALCLRIITTLSGGCPAVAAAAVF